MLLVLVGLLIVAVGCQASDVFYVASANGRYKIESLNQAKQLCKAYNGRVATANELTQAQKDGYEMCNCGWLADGQVAYPIQTPRPGCGDRAGVHYCPVRPQDWGNKGWDSYCVRNKEPDCPNEYSFGLPLAKYSVKQTDWAQIFVDLIFPADGKVVGWNYFSLRPDMQAFVAVWRQPDKSKREIQLVGRNRLPTGRIGHVKYFVDEHYQIQVKKGDFIGIHYDSILDWGNNNDAVIPLAQSPNDLCAEDDSCVRQEDLSTTWVLHRHEQQLAYRRLVVIDVEKISEKLTKQRAPALRPIMCAYNGGDLPTEVTTTTTEAPVTVPELTTPSETPAPTPEAPELTESTEATTTTESEITEGPTESTTEKEAPPPTTTTTTTAAPPTTTTAAAPTPSAVTEDGPQVAEAASRDTPCHFPFQYRKQLVYACTSMLADKPWCSTSEVYDGQNWRYCHEGDVRVEDMPCHFPFTYKGNKYSSCISAFSERPWCSVVAEYSQHAWKYCTEEDAVEAVPCHIPFAYNGNEYSMCIRQGSPNFWCATEAEYGTYSWRNCNEKDPIPAKMPCHFPFIFEDKEVNTCIEKGAGKHWCAVERNYNGENWRYCREGDKFPEERPCHFPFLYNGKEINACIAENSNRPWCSQVPVYDYQKDWKYCRQVQLFHLYGNKAKTVDEAVAKCREQNMILAMERDASAAYELGNESCECGWVSNGMAIRIVQDPRKDCNEGGAKGIQTCADSSQGFVPICVLDE